MAAYIAQDEAPVAAPALVDALGRPLGGQAGLEASAEREVLRDPFPLADELRRRGKLLRPQVLVVEMGLLGSRGEVRKDLEDLLLATEAELALIGRQPVDSQSIPVKLVVRESSLRG